MRTGTEKKSGECPAATEMDQNKIRNTESERRALI